MPSQFKSSLFRARYLFATVSLFALASTGLFPLVALELSARGFDDRTIGAMTSVFYLGGVLSAFSYGAYLGRFGLRIGIATAAVLAAASTAGLTLFDSSWIWVGLRFVTGFALGSYYLTMDSWMGSLASPSSRGRLFATYTTVRVLATAIGPIIIIVGSTQFSILALCMIFVIAAIPSSFNEETANSVGKSIDLPSILNTVKQFRWMFLIIMCCGLQNASFYGLGAVYSKAVGMSDARTAFFFSAVLFAPVLIGIPIGGLSDRFTRMGVASYISMAAAAMAFAMSVAVNLGLWALTIGGVIVGGCMVSMYGLALSRIVDLMGSDQSVRAATVALLAYQLGSFLGPVSSGLLTHKFGTENLYVAIAVYALIAFTAAKLGSKSSD